jgi:hypothetical protein
MVVKVRDRLTGNKQTSHRFYMGRLNFKSNKVEGKENYHVQVCNSFAALEGLDSEVEIKGN